MSSKRVSILGKLYDEHHGNVELEPIILSIKSEVRFNILTGAKLPFSLYEKRPKNLSAVDGGYLLSQLEVSGILLSIEDMQVIELL